VFGLGAQEQQKHAINCQVIVKILGDMNSRVVILILSVWTGTIAYFTTHGRIASMLLIMDANQREPAIPFRKAARELLIVQNASSIPVVLGIMLAMMNFIVFIVLNTLQKRHAQQTAHGTVVLVVQEPTLRI
jgi:hypothetical protein